MNWARIADRFARANHLPRSRLSISCVMNVQSCHSYSGFLFVHAQKDEKERKLHLSHARVAQVEDLFNMFRLSRRTDPYLIWCYQDSDTLVFVLNSGLPVLLPRSIHRAQANHSVTCSISLFFFAHEGFSDMIYWCHLLTCIWKLNII